KRDISLARLKLEMSKFGIDRALTISVKGIFYDHILGNDETKEVCSRDPKFIPTLTIDPRRSVDYDKEIEKRKLEGFKILRLFPEYQGFTIRSCHVRRIAAKAMENDLPLMISAKDGITSVLDLLREFRKLRTILTGVSYFGLAELLVAMEECDNLFVETRLLDSVDGINIIVEKFCAERLVFGSGAPLGYIGSSLNLIKYAQISEAEKETILAGSIRKLMGGD
ncbi:MAG: amidohydrolase family protein, partial [Candidatus Bathyarchaeia archaeon]